ncbi:MULTISPECIES: TraM recognition domain-containing protein [unclassified Paenarthrobacter]|uniref:type IV secretory system conjugative DNA transfer family protein n=1 Tax=unclassified Paenarthrobacter TaxID=2634190 RepID=UPI00141FB16D|nr:MULTISPECIES: TraM recognition domain-containing protein [unclassified Paenarthrobacter]NHW49243.1 TraM recognition domain-containing protein [Paenarthrobacter sp. MSM-2-10-13]WIV33514.1 TraM recognition domain-containing protein [Paenarthrobacter sp. R1]
MTENITVEKHSPSGSTVKKTEREMIVLAILSAGLWHVALVWTTGLAFSNWMETWKALIGSLIGLIAPERATSPVAVNGNPPDQWGWPVTVWIILVVLLIAAYIGALFGLKALRARLKKAKTGEKGLSTAKGLKSRIEGAEKSSLAPAVYVLDGMEIAIRTEDTACTVAPPKWGKTTYMVAGMVADAAGAVITTSTRPDVLRLTVGVRKDLGTVYVADFDGLSQYPHKLRWHMVGGCEDPQVASERASAMVNAMPRTGAPSSADRYFDSGCVMILEALLHAAALKEGGSMRDVIRWSQNFAEHEPANILRTKSPSVKTWAGNLDEWCRQNNPDTIGNTKTTLGKITGPMKNENVLSMLCATDDDPGIDLNTFTDAPNSLYCLTRVSMNASTAPIVTALVESLVQAAIRKSGAMASGKLNVPLSVILDEAANTCALPSLPSLMSEGGGNGIHTSVFVQTYSQLVNRWGEEGAETIFDSAAAKTIFGGISDVKFLTKISDLIGKHWVEHTSTSSSTGKDGVPSVSTSKTKQLDTKMRVDEIRKLSQGKVLLMYREIEAVVNVVPWWERPDSAKFKASRVWCLEQEGITAESAAKAAAAETAAEANLAAAS